ncbi:HNH endonuclease [Aeromonas veronii]
MKENYPYLYDGYGLADYIVRSLRDLDNSDWHGDAIDFLNCADVGELLSIICKWNKFCVLNNIIDGALYLYIDWYADKVDPLEFVEENISFIEDRGIKAGLRIYNSEYNVDSEVELDELYKDLILKMNNIIHESCFVLLFSDRDFLYRLQILISGIVSSLKISDYPDYLKCDGVIKRPSTKFPEWLKRAVFYRDKGRCQICGIDLSNTYIYKNKNYDHMIPLQSSGSNDPTNIQLACESCNKGKQDKLIVKKVPTQRYW